MNMDPEAHGRLVFSRVSKKWRTDWTGNMSMTYGVGFHDTVANVRVSCDNLDNYYHSIIRLLSSNSNSNEYQIAVLN